MASLTPQAAQPKKKPALAIMIGVGPDGGPGKLPPRGGAPPSDPPMPPAQYSTPPPPVQTPEVQPGTGVPEGGEGGPVQLYEQLDPVTVHFHSPEEICGNCTYFQDADSSCKIVSGVAPIQHGSSCILFDSKAEEASEMSGAPGMTQGAPEGLTG